MTLKATAVTSADSQHLARQTMRRRQAESLDHDADTADQQMRLCLSRRAEAARKRPT